MVLPYGAQFPLNAEHRVPDVCGMEAQDATSPLRVAGETRQCVYCIVTLELMDALPSPVKAEPTASGSVALSGSSGSNDTDTDTGTDTDPSNQV